MTQEELSKAVSLVQMLPIGHTYPKDQAVPMMRIFSYVKGSQRYFFASLHPGLKIYS